jgi:hypothetical protein
MLTFFSLPAVLYLSEDTLTLHQGQGGQHQHENDLPPRRSCKIRKGNREEVAGIITRRKARPLSETVALGDEQ